MQKNSFFVSAIIVGLTLFLIFPASGIAGKKKNKGPTFKQCKRIDPNGDYSLMEEKKNCFKEFAIKRGAKKHKSADFQICQNWDAKNNYNFMKEKKKCFQQLGKELKACGKPLGIGC